MKLRNGQRHGASLLEVLRFRFFFSGFPFSRVALLLAVDGERDRLRGGGYRSGILATRASAIREAIVLVGPRGIKTPAKFFGSAK